MNRLFDKKSKKSPKPPRQHIASGIPTNIAIGPLGFRAELDIDPKDEENPRPSRIVFQDEEREDQGLPASETLIPGVAVDNTEGRNDPTSDASDPRHHCQSSCGSPCPSPPGGDESNTREGQSEPAEAMRDCKDTALADTAIRTDVPRGSAEGFGPLKNILGAIPVAYLDREGITAVKNKIEDLLLRTAALEARFAMRPGDVAEQRRRNDLIRKFKVIEGQLESWSKKPRSQKPAGRSQDDEVVPGLLEDLRECISHYQMDHRMATSDQECGPMNPADAAVLNNFRCAQEAEYRHGGRNGCLKGTRRAILDEIEHWARDFSKPPVYWLNGLAGTGKSTIAQTIAERLFAEGRLGASFFCSRDFEDRSNLHFIFPTLAVQLARRYAEFRSILVPLVQADPGIAYESLYNQMKKLIVQPLKESATSTVIVVDALDECKDNEPASAILSVLGQFVSQIPDVKILVTGRPEPRIREGFHLPLLAHVTDVFVLHEVEPSRVSNDIQLFFKHRFMELASRQRGLDGWPTAEQLGLLCRRAAGLFVYAVATVKFIGQRNNSPRKQLDRLLQSPESSEFEGKTKIKENATLNSLYTSILQEAFSEDDLDVDSKVRSVLGAVVLVTSPLPPSTIATLLNFDLEEVLPILMSTHSLLTLEEDDEDRPVRSFHKSFPDFIVDPARCTNPRFHVNPPDHHMELLVGCLTLMDQRLEQNMCKLPNGVINSEVNDLKERTKRNIDHALQYACRSWHKHLAATAPAHTSKIAFALHRFLEGKFIFWLEVLSVLGAAREAVDALDVSAGRFNASPTLDLINDYRRFVIRFFEVISASAPHIYHSALPLSPQTSTVRQLYERYACPLVRAVQGTPLPWEPIVSTFRHRRWVGKAAWSPCSRYIAVSLDDSETVEILDAVTLGKLHNFESQNGDGWLCFSPDSRSLTKIGCGHGGFITWDLQTGGQASPVSTSQNMADSKCISSTYSADGKMIAALYENPESTSIYTHNLHSGTHAFSYHPREGRIVPPLWLHDRHLRFVDVKPGSINIREAEFTAWEVGFTTMHVPTKVESLPAPGNIGDIQTALYLPTRSWLAFVHAGKKVLIWDARDSRFLLDFSDNINRHTRISSSSDGRFFACGASNLDVHLWEESPTGYVLRRKLVSGVGMYHVEPLLSPNGGSLITCPRDETQLWRTADSITLLSSSSTPPTGTEYDFFLEFSPGGSLAATARLGEKIATVFNLKSGNPRLIVDMGMEIWGLRVTENVIVVVGGGKIITWNLPSEDRITNTRATTNDSVRTVAFNHPASHPGCFNSAAISPDFNHIIVTQGPDEDQETQLDIYDMCTGKHLANVDAPAYMPFTVDGSEFWGLRGVFEFGWKIIKDEESNVIGLKPLPEDACPPGGYPWISPHGHYVTNDGWIFNSRKKRLLWMPHNWREREGNLWWNGQFLGFSSGDLPEPVILELSE